ncbi:conserved hypothetical protein [Acidovorax delafieldii 2AN]|uniref:Cyclophilin-like domain-containing protein n=1 Tax=Acidovorax delafieldii 2AN TaxID=573060 RepID=C5T138_ACIDE|nr:cyclophilin-like fold protein [Acidovorax delafieldii]EER61782.1 conserved hypothetical protein [Acidovorax delafieldii 2AN]
MNKPYDSGSTGTCRAALCLAAMMGLGMSSPSAVAEAQANERKQARDGQKIVLTTADGVKAQATLLDNATARTFAAKLPLKVRMGDHFGRELYGPMPTIAVSDPLRKTYQAGDIAYWPPAPGFAIYYTVGGPVIPGDGLALLGSIDTNLDIFSRGSTEVTIELAK